MKIVKTVMILIGMFASIYANDTLKTSVSLVRLDKSLEVKVIFQNISDRPLRIYFIPT